VRTISIRAEGTISIYDFWTMRRMPDLPDNQELRNTP
jgi:hypothetical protein